MIQEQVGLKIGAHEVVGSQEFGGLAEIGALETDRVIDPVSTRVLPGDSDGERIGIEGVYGSITEFDGGDGEQS
jgi:hypothetical protein